jgi:hypothetical protein
VLDRGQLYNPGGGGGREGARLAVLVWWEALRGTKDGLDAVERAKSATPAGS